MNIWLGYSEVSDLSQKSIKELLAYINILKRIKTPKEKYPQALIYISKVSEDNLPFSLISPLMCTSSFSKISLSISIVDNFLVMFNASPTSSW